MRITLKKFGVFAVFVALVALLLTPSTASAASNSDKGGKLTTAEQQTLFRGYGLTTREYGSVVIDSNLTYDQAVGDDKVLAADMEQHMKMRPYLRVVPVVYHGYDSRVHLGQMVVHQYIAADVAVLFIQMFADNFPIQSAIPESQFGYVDEQSMLANNSSGYRPADQEHGYGAAVDINPFTNPMDVTDPTTGVRTIDPPSAMYNPAAKGAVVMEGPVRRAWTARDFEWGGNWGNPMADPSKDFYQVGYFDYQHFQLSEPRYDYFHAHLPAGV